MIQFDEHIFQMGWNHQLAGNISWSKEMMGPLPKSHDFLTKYVRGRVDQVPLFLYRGWENQPNSRGLYTH